ncbi:MAG: LptF/LptG family permease [Bacteroidetes bacterium]|nr:LptF/LptG family permease [Bacteroidota bacterium]
MSYARPLLRSFAVCLVILVLQFLSRYKGDLFGKGLEAFTIFKIFAFASISLVVLALPVAVLLSSLFTMGNFGENYELAAMRSAGMSLPRILRPMFFVTLLVSLMSFGLSSYIVPWANLKLYAILYDVQQLKPVFRLEPGHFNSGIDDYVIRITDKDVSKDLLHGISIYDHTFFPGEDTMPVIFYNRGTPMEIAQIMDSSGRNNRFVMADSGTMRLDPYGKYMNMMLYHGATYEAKVEINRRGRREEQFVRVFFDSLFYSFDMKGFDLERTEEKEFSSHQYMLNLTDLGTAMDSIRAVKAEFSKQYEAAMAENIMLDSSFIRVDTLTYAIPPEDILRYFPKNKRAAILNDAMTNVQGAISVIRAGIDVFGKEDKKIRERGIEFHFKFSLPLACLIFLFIGAPLGAIIRKGGAGVPIVVSVVLYLSFYVLMIQGKKMATEGVLSPFFGAWLPVLVMLPLAILLSLESAAAVPIFTGDNFWKFSRAFVRILIITNPLYWLYQIPPVGRAMDAIGRPIAKLFRRKEEKRTFRVRR